MEEVDWDARADREAAALLARHLTPDTDPERYDALIQLLAAAYHQGRIDSLKRALEIIGEQA